LKKLLILMVTALAFVFQLAATTPAARSAEIAQQARPAGAIAGKITDESGSSIAGATAEAFSCSEETPSGSAVSDKDGQYVIGALSDGCYHVRFSGERYESSWHGESQLHDTASDVNVSGNQVPGCDAQLSEAGSVISGTVKTTEGKPLPGVLVTAFRPSSGKIEGSISDGRTDAKGAFSVRVFPGSYVVIFARKGYVMQIHGRSPEDPTMVEAAEGVTVRGIDATLSRGGRITGSVTDEAGKALKGIYVVTDSAAKTALPVAAQSDAEGKFVLDGLATGKYKIFFGDREQKYLPQWHDAKTDPDKADLVSVTAPGTTPGIRAVLRQSGGISGRVTDETGNAIPKVFVSAEPIDQKSIGASAITDDNGAYNLAGLSSASYHVSFRKVGSAHLPRYYHDAANGEAAHAVDVTAPRVTTGIDQTLPAGALLTGSVSSDAPIPGAMIIVYPAAADSKAEPVYSFTGADGTFSVALAEGDYLVEFSAPAGGYLPQWSGNRPTRGEATPVTVSLKEGTAKQVVVLSRGASISGTVKNRAGIGLKGVTVTARDAATSDRNGSATTDEAGKYLIQALKSGSFYLAADGAAAGQLAAKLPQPVTVSAPATVENIDMILDPGGAVSGKVTDPAGNPVQGVNVTAHDPATWDEFGSVYTGSDGQYKIGGLPENAYHIRFEKSDSKYTVQWYKGKFRREESSPVQIAGTAGIAGIDVTLSLGVPLTGSVTDAKGAPLHDATVEVYGGTEDEPFAEVRTDAGGSYTVPGLAPGNYRIRFSHDDYVPRWYGGSDRMTAAILGVKDAAIPPLSAALAKAGGKFSGKLMNPQGQKIGQAWITAIDAATGIAVADERICECSGKFNTPVPSGIYQLKVERHGQVVWFGGNTREEAIPLEASGEISGLEMVIDDKIVKTKQVPVNANGGRLQ
jgi:5-hydroxyisourate hydrolase-like protein (transthyretin family)